MTQIDNTDALVGVVRDTLLSEINAAEGKAWHNLKEGAQRELMMRLEGIGRSLVSRLVNTIAADDRPTLVGKCDSVAATGDKLRAVITLDRDDPQRYDLLDAAGKSLLIVVTDVDRYLESGDRPKLNPEQEDIEDAIRRRAQESASGAEVVFADVPEQPTRLRRGSKPAADAAMAATAAEADAPPAEDKKPRGRRKAAEPAPEPAVTNGDWVDGAVAAADGAEPEGDEPEDTGGGYGGTTEDEADESMADEVAAEDAAPEPETAPAPTGRRGRRPAVAAVEAPAPEPEVTAPAPSRRQREVTPIPKTSSRSQAPKAEARRGRG